MGQLCPLSSEMATVSGARGGAQRRLDQRVPEHHALPGTGHGQDEGRFRVESEIESGAIRAYPSGCEVRRSSDQRAIEIAPLGFLFGAVCVDPGDFDFSGVIGERIVDGEKQ